MAVIQDYQAREHLLTVLKERGIGLGSDDISWAFASSKTRDQSIAWVKEYLQDATLLTKDELETLEKNSSTANYGVNQGADQPALSDQDMKLAIESLQTSTALIEKHSKALEAQRDALQAFKSQSHDASIVQSPAVTLARDMSRMEFTFEESMHTLKDKFSDVDKQTTRAMSSLNTLITERLRADDDVLQALSNLASKTAPSSQSGSVDPSTIDQWCQALIMLRESETNSHIDAALNNHICDIIESGRGPHPHHGHVEADLQAELRTLREEIPSVVELVVASSLRQPLLRLMRGTRHQAIVRQSEWLHYILDTFGHMINQLHLISSHATKLHGYSHALSEVRTALDALQNPNSAGTSSSTVTPPTTSYAGSSRPMHARSDSRAGASAAGNASLAEQTCKRFAISRPSVSALEAVSASATAKMLEQYATATSTTQEVISKALDEQSRNLESALGQLYAHSRYASVELLPRDLERDVKALDEAIAATVVGLDGAEKGKHENVKQVIAQIKEKLQPAA